MREMMDDAGYVRKLLQQHTASDYIAAGVTILAIVGVFLPFYIKGIVPESASPETMAMIIAVVTLLFGDRFIDLFRKKEDKKTIIELMDVIQKPITQAIECRHMGTYAEALEYVKTRLPYACAVKDVTIVHGLSKKELELYFLKKDESNLMSKVIAKFVNEGYIWRGIVSENIVKILVNKAYQHIDNGKEMLFNVKKTLIPFPAINFTIIEYRGDDNKQVLFGWGHHKFDDEGHVFSSTNRFLVETFDRIFQTLSERDLTEDIEPPVQREKPKATPVPVQPAAAAAE